MNEELKEIIIKKYLKGITVSSLSNEYKLTPEAINEVILGSKEEINMVISERLPASYQAKITDEPTQNIKILKSYWLSLDLCDDSLDLATRKAYIDLLSYVSHTEFPDKNKVLALNGIIAFMAKGEK